MTIGASTMIFLSLDLLHYFTLKPTKPVAEDLVLTKNVLKDSSVEMLRKGRNLLFEFRDLINEEGKKKKLLL